MPEFCIFSIALITQLVDVFGHGKEMNLVLEYVQGDLKQIIENRQYLLDAGDRKSIMLQAMRGLEYLHNNWILHRVCFRTLSFLWNDRYFVGDLYPLFAITGYKT